ncbi:bifunctional aspartate kinase/homoserine dehydrogenase I [Muriicola sp. Z0-33]|uniref:bifunctional aspartate kinase/homoserine dehydrogenase I n=1 Tax=Muriicola sp. Z0-33 TaxID=2816957 RepID=UPI0022375D22|nr:bifunctional aspartate kinase/homoserine dehydrogenase I [Muriicola sp. Z0-33]MCW5517423.1 bifunctional aspartate kinase/homoserine dehydrogenase I [Muriicola sp. Z0-33]
MKVLKFGGTSVANSENISRVQKIVAAASSEQTAVVVSALGGTTDLLLQAADLAASQQGDHKEILKEIERRHIVTIKELLPIQAQSAVLSKIKSQLNKLEALLDGANMVGEVTAKLSDKIVSHGELLSAHIISDYFQTSGLDAIFADSRELIKTDNAFGKAAINFELTNANCIAFFQEAKQKIIVLPGFVSSSVSGEPTTLGRGGSDYTAAVIAAALDAEELQIWTDVSGMYTANPKLVKQAKALSELSYEEAMELSHFGAKVLYPPTIQPVFTKGIPILIKNTFDPQAKGTKIARNENTNGKTVRGISNIPNIALLSLEGPGMIGIPGISKRFFEVLSTAEISVVLITQASSEHSICVGVADEDADKAAAKINEAFEFEMSTGKLLPVVVEKKLAIIALVGDNMKSHQGLSGKMFSALGKNNVNIRAIAQGASERNISAVINGTDVKKALNTLHEAFFEDNVKQLNLYVKGVGNVGAKFLEQIKQQKNFLKKQLKLNIRVIGIANSRTMVFNEDGISLQDWEAQLSEGEKADSTSFNNRIQEYNFRNSIFVDNTASKEVSDSYEHYLSDSISVVTCNKIACSSEYDNYNKLKELSREYNAPFLFETNVGAGLPIIDTLKHLIASGDKVMKIQAVLSGSLNFVFNNFNADVSFHDIVKQAQEQGYTEPDPKIDLSGIDVMRKILILARESGYKLNIEDIENRSFLPQESLDTSNNEDFFRTLKENESKFQNIYKAAESSGSKLKYVAQFEDGKASVGLQNIPEGHDFYSLEGSDNIVLFYTERYPDQPMIIKGAGAGAEVTASGIFADIIRIGNF